MGTLHSLAEARTGQAPASTSSASPAAEEWRLLAERAGQVLDALEAAAEGRRRPGLALLSSQTAGLRTALECAVQRELEVAAIAEAAVRQADRERASARPDAPRRTGPRGMRLRPVPGGAT